MTRRISSWVPTINLVRLSHSPCHSHSSLKQAEVARYMSNRDAAESLTKVILPLMSWDGGLPMKKISLDVKSSQEVP